MQGFVDYRPHLGYVPTGAHVGQVGAHPVHLVMVSTGQQKDELRVAGLQHGAAVEQSLSEERFAERQCAGLGNDGLVQVEKGRGAGSRSGASRCLRWGLPLGGRVGDGHRPSIGRQLDRPATLFPNRSIDYRCCREVKSIYTAQAVLSIASGTCVTAHCHVYSKHYSAIAEGVSVRPPGADARRPSPPPPLAGVVPFGSHANVVSPVLSPAFWALRESCCPDPLRGVCAQLHVCPQLRLWDWCPTPWTPHGGWVTVFSGPGGPSGSHPVGSGVLAMLTDPGLRDELDRVAAAVGVRVVHLGGRHPVSRKTWSAAAAVVLDHAAADRCGRLALPRRTHVSVLTGTEAATATWAAAITVGAQHVLRMPEQEGELVRELAEAAESARDDGICGAVVAVIGGRGGAGASLFAVALAQAAADALLVDLDPWAGGIDLLVGGETAPGLRWPDLALQGGRLNWSAVRAALPRPRGISVLSGTRRGYELDAGPVDAVIDAGRRGGVTVVCDLPRRLTDATQAALDAADLVVLVSPCDVRACAAAATMAPVLTAINPNLGLVVRGPSPGGLRAAEVADVAGVPLLASMRAQPRLAEQLEHGGLRLRRRSVLASAARRVLGVLPRAGSGRHGRAA